MAIIDNVCYVCLLGSESEPLLEKDLVRPCTNEKCTAKIHKRCLVQQLKSNIKKCGICQSPIHVNKDTKINKMRCVMYSLKRLNNILILFIGPIVLILLTLGNTIGNWQDCNRTNPGLPCDANAIPTLLITMLLWALFFQFPFFKSKYHIFCCESIKQKLKWKSTITMNIMFVITCGLVVLAHCIGYPIIKYMYEMDVFFTWRSALAGFACYAIAVGFGIVVSILTYMIYSFYAHTTEKFSEPKISYGV